MGLLSLPVLLIGLQVTFIILFGVFVKYDDLAGSPWKEHLLQYQNNHDHHDDGDHRNHRSVQSDEANASLALNSSLLVENYTNSTMMDTVHFVAPKVHFIADTTQQKYGVFQDVHVMIFVGFGFLMSFLKRYGYSSVTFNLLVAALAIQWAILTNGWILNFHDQVIKISMNTILKAEFAAAAVLVSFGAVLGKLNPLQLVIMALLEILLYQCNELLVLGVFQASDVGGSLLVHVFGAYFGLMVALFTARPGDVQTQSYKELSVYHSDLFSMIGTIFLWLFWPSFNSAFATGDGQYRAVVNTYLALASSAVVAMAVSALVQKNKRFTMIHVQNATLAGGVALGAMADILVCPFGALVTGALAGALSVIGYQYMTPCCNQRMKIHDTRGVHNVHGLPGLVSAIGAIICTAVAKPESYGHSFQEIFPAVADGSRTIEEQAEYQLAALAVTVAISIGGGVLTGFLLRLPFWNQPKGAEIMDDWDFWVLPSDGYPVIPNTVNAPPIYKLPESAAMMDNNA